MGDTTDYLLAASESAWQGDLEGSFEWVDKLEANAVRNVCDCNGKRKGLIAVRR